LEGRGKKKKGMEWNCGEGSRIPSKGHFSSPSLNKYASKPKAQK
jgi:hypothetical protein